MNKNDIPKEIYMYGHDHLLKVYFCSDKKYDDSEKYIHENEVKQLDKKARCWDKLWFWNPPADFEKSDLHEKMQELQDNNELINAECKHKIILDKIKNRINWLITEAKSLPDPDKNANKYTVILQTIKRIEQEVEADE